MWGTSKVESGEKSLTAGVEKAWAAQKFSPDLRRLPEGQVQLNTGGLREKRGKEGATPGVGKVGKTQTTAGGPCNPAKRMGQSRLQTLRQPTGPKGRKVLRIKTRGRDQQVSGGGPRRPKKLEYGGGGRIVERGKGERGGGAKRTERDTNPRGQEKVIGLKKVVRICHEMEGYKKITTGQRRGEHTVPTSVVLP